MRISTCSSWSAALYLDGVRTRRDPAWWVSEVATTRRIHSPSARSQAYAAALGEVKPEPSGPRSARTGDRRTLGSPDPVGAGPDTPDGVEPPGAQTYERDNGQRGHLFCGACGPQ